MAFYSKEEKSEIRKKLNGKRIGEVYNLINKVDSTRSEVEALIAEIEAEYASTAKVKIELNDTPCPLNIFGRDIIARNAISDMDMITRLPFVIGAAIMPDGHRVKENHVVVGGVVVTDGNVVIPANVGADISCSVFITVFDVIVTDEIMKQWHDSMVYVLSNYAYFGVENNPYSNAKSQGFYSRFPVLKSELGKSIEHALLGQAVDQFRTFGDGNHFGEFGMSNVMFDEKSKRWVRTKETRLSFMSHFGSRAVGATIAKTFEEFAINKYDMPKGCGDAPLYLDSPEGEDYWALMNWAGEFAEAGHKENHKVLFEQLASKVKIDAKIRSNSIFSRHNFAWKNDDGTITHRKGATPAAYGQYGIIPATMGHKSKIVMGLGNPESFNSASHGGGRTHSRGQALQEFGGGDTAAFVKKEYGITLIGGDADEDPRAYKDIDAVMERQKDCVTVIGDFMPSVVRMANPRFGTRRR